MKELVIISGKGGTGKTSITAALASLAEKIVLADCDVDAADLHLVLCPRIVKQENFWGGKLARIDLQRCTECGRCREVCRFEAITTDYVVDAIACEGCGVCVWNCPVAAISFEPRQSGVWYFSETSRGPMVHATLGIAEENSGKLVTVVRREARQQAENRGAELLLVDGPPGTGCPVIAAIGGADEVLIVTEPTVSAIHDMYRVWQLARHFQVHALLCINKWDLNEELTGSIEKFAAENGLPVVGKISFDRQVTQAQVAGKTVFELGDYKLQDEFLELWQNIRRFF